MEDSRRVDELQALVRRQQLTIAKLQNQIRERCQSYLLHASRHKQHTPAKLENGGSEYPGSNVKEGANQIEEKKSVKEEDSEMESLTDSKTSNQIVTLEDERLKRRQRLRISREVDISEEYNLRQAAKQAQTAQIIESYKQRFALLQRTKNDTTKELQKILLENKELKNYVLKLQRDLEKTTKAESKLREKLKKMPEYQTAINEIYIKLMVKIQGEEESDRIGREEKQTNAKIEDILKWIAESMGKVDSILEGFAADQETKEIQTVTSRDMQFESITKPFQPEAEMWSSVQKQGEKQEEGVMTNSELKLAEDINQVSAFSAKKEQEYSIIRGLEQYNEELEKELSRVKQDYQKVKEEISRSRILQESSIIKELSTLKQELEKSKLTTNPVTNTSKMSVDQQLEAPYFVQEELATDSNHEYVKRSFVRKKIVRRNLSATAYRVVSKSKEEVDSIIQGKIKNYTDRSVQKAKHVKNTREAKLQALKNSMKDVRVSEVSRQSDVSRQSGKECEEQIKVIEVTTHTANEEIKSTKIYSQTGEQSLSFRRKN